MTFKTADLCDEFPDRVSVREPLFESFGAKRRFAGMVATVRVREDNVLVREALETLPAGTVLVVDGGGSKRCALLGDKLAAIAVERNLGGVIVNGCARDARAFRGWISASWRWRAGPCEARKKARARGTRP